jgi:hypothetical protein
MANMRIASALVFTAVTAFAVGANVAPKAERSPHVEALELVFKTQTEKIRAVDKDNWWHDCKERTWVARRPFHPGIFDSTHMFDVTYRIDGKDVARWSVDTRERSVKEVKPGK